MTDLEYLFIFFVIVMPAIEDFAPDYIFVSTGEKKDRWMYTCRLWCCCWWSGGELQGDPWCIWTDDQGKQRRVNIHMWHNPHMYTHFHTIHTCTQELRSYMGGKNLILSLEVLCSSIKICDYNFECGWGWAVYLVPRPQPFDKLIVIVNDHMIVKTYCE